MKKVNLWIAVFLLPTIALFILIYGIPLVTVVFTSFFEWKGFSNTIKFAGISNYINLFTADSAFRESLINNIIWVLLQCTVHVSLGTLLAIILSKKVFGWKFVRAVYMIPNIISAAALGIIFLNIYNPQYGIVNSFIRQLGVKDYSQNWYFDTNTAFFAVTSSWIFFAAVITIMVMAEIMSISESVFESAKIDGASPMMVDLYITLPMLRNILGTCVILSATSKLKEFELIYLTTKGGPVNATLNLPLYLYKMSLIENNYGYANAIGTILMVLGLISVLMSTRLFRLGNSDF